MSFEVPTDRHYRDTHEWVRQTDGTVRVGITDFAQDELGDVVFVELPETGDALSTGDALGVVESIKAVSDIYAPVAGTVTAVNERLLDEPELVNEDPFGEGWFVDMEVTDDDAVDDLLDADAYRDQIE